MYVLGGGLLAKHLENIDLPFVKNRTGKPRDLANHTFCLFVFVNGKTLSSSSVWRTVLLYSTVYAELVV